MKFIRYNSFRWQESLLLACALIFVETQVQPVFSVAESPTCIELASSEKKACELAASVTVAFLEPNLTTQGKDRIAGSGVIIRREKLSSNSYRYTVLTAKHVVSGPIAYEIQTIDQKRYSVDPINIDKLNEFKRDIAIVSFTSNEEYQAAPIADTSSLIPKTEIYSSGFSLDGSFIFSDAKLRSIDEISAQYQGKYDLTFSSSIQSGMSGGPLLSKSGEVVGINAAANLPLPGINAGVSISSLQTELDRERPTLARASDFPSSSSPDSDYYTFNNLKQYQDCIEDVLQLYQGRQSEKSICPQNISNTFGSTLSQSQARDLINTAHKRATTAFLGIQFKITPAQRMRIEQLLELSLPN